MTETLSEEVFASSDALPLRKASWWWTAAGACFLSGMTAFAWRVLSVPLSLDGKIHRVLLHGERVADILKDHHVVLGAADFVTPALDAPLTRLTEIHVTRVIERPIDVQRIVPATIESDLHTDKNLRPVVAERGAAKDITETFLVTFHDGQEVKRRPVHLKTARFPFYNLTLLDRQGGAMKRYDLTHARKVQAIATGYYVGDPLVPSDTTYLGYKLRRGLIAVDPALIPLHTRLYIPGYGYGYAADTGSKIKGNRIDLAVKDRHEERLYMHRPMTVYVLDQTGHW